MAWAFALEASAFRLGSSHISYFAGPASYWDNSDSSSDREISSDFNEPRFQYLNEIMADLVHDEFVEYASISIGTEIQLKRLRFHEPFCRAVFNHDFGKVRLFRHWTEARELFTDQLDRVV